LYRKLLESGNYC